MVSRASLEGQVESKVLFYTNDLEIGIMKKKQSEIFTLKISTSSKNLEIFNSRLLRNSNNWSNKFESLIDVRLYIVNSSP